MYAIRALKLDDETIQASQEDQPLRDHVKVITVPVDDNPSAMMIRGLIEDHFPVIEHTFYMNSDHPVDIVPPTGSFKTYDDEKIITWVFRIVDL